MWALSPGWSRKGAREPAKAGERLGNQTKELTLKKGMGRIIIWPWLHSGGVSRGSDSHRPRERSREIAERHSKSPHHGWHCYHNVALDAKSRVLRRATRSPLSEEIECTEMSRQFTRPLFTILWRKDWSCWARKSLYTHDVALFS